MIFTHHPPIRKMKAMEEFKLKEGSGTTITVENGTVLNINGNVIWEEIN